MLKRDKFTCQYCGSKAPDAVLEIDHIEPVSKGGSDDLMNLITSCHDCNSGKSARLLSDDSVVEKRRQQAEALQDRKEQLEMMYEWQKGLLEVDEKAVELAIEFWGKQAPGAYLTEAGIQDLRRLLRQFSFDEVLTAMDIAACQYFDLIDGIPTVPSLEQAWQRLGGICFNRCKARGGE